MLDYRPPRAHLIPWKIHVNDYGVPSSRFFRGLSICYLDEEQPIYFDGIYRQVIIEDHKEETFKEESNKKEVQVTKPQQVVDNIV